MHYLPQSLLQVVAGTAERDTAAEGSAEEDTRLLVRKRRQEPEEAANGGEGEERESHAGWW